MQYLWQMTKRNVWKKGQRYGRTRCETNIIQSQDDSNRETAMYQPAAIFAAAIPPQGATTAHLNREAEQVSLRWWVFSRVRMRIINQHDDNEDDWSWWWLLCCWCWPDVTHVAGIVHWYGRPLRLREDCHLMGRSELLGYISYNCQPYQTRYILDLVK